MIKNTLIPNVETLSLVAYFRDEPSDLVGLLRGAKRLAQDYYGDTRGTYYISQNRPPLAPPLDPSEKMPPSSKYDSNLSDDRDINLAVEYGRFYYCFYNKPRDRKVFCDATSGFWLMWDVAIEIDLVPIMSGLRLPPMVRIDFTISRFEDSKVNAAIAIARQFAVLADTHGDIGSGFGDVATAAETSLGREYSSTHISWVSGHTKLARNYWVFAGDTRIEKMRGVFWVNILNSAMVDKLGGYARLSSEFAEMNAGTSVDLVTELPSGGAVVALAHLAKDFMSHGNDLGWGKRAVWLRSRLMERGLLC